VFFWRSPLPSKTAPLLMQASKNSYQASSLPRPGHVRRLDRHLAGVNGRCIACGLKRHQWHDGIRERGAPGVADASARPATIRGVVLSFAFAAGSAYSSRAPALSAVAFVASCEAVCAHTSSCRPAHAAPFVLRLAAGEGNFVLESGAVFSLPCSQFRHQGAQLIVGLDECVIV
jgi:hypothetical protein